MGRSVRTGSNTHAQLTKPGNRNYRPRSFRTTSVVMASAVANGAKPKLRACSSSIALEPLSSHLVAPPALLDHGWQAFCIYDDVPPWQRRVLL